LERLGYQVTIRTSSLEALHAFRAKPNNFDVVVTDQNMPQITGFQFASELLRIRPEIPVILITGFSESVTPEACRQAGIRDFVMKPVVARDLSRAIRRAVDGETMPV
jgi:CheY-like chemotaxis protein